jgi:hypothetical protein
MVTTVDDLASVELLEVIGGYAVPRDGQAIDEVRCCGADWQPLYASAKPGEQRRFLAVLPAEEPPAGIEAALRALARQGAVAVSLSGDCSRLSIDEVRRVAETCDVVALAAPGAPSTSQLHEALSLRQNEALRRRIETDRHLSRLCAQLHRQGAGPRRLLDHVEQHTGVRLDLLVRGDALWRELAAREPDLERLAQGAVDAKSARTATAPTSTDAASAAAISSWHFSLHALPVSRPRPVLYARTPGPMSASTVDLIEHTASMASMLVDRPHHRTPSAAAPTVNRAEILMHLQSGDVDKAATLAERFAPGVLTAPGGRFAIVECGAQEDRSQVSAICEGTLSPAVVAQCPLNERHLVCVFPAGADDETVEKTMAPLARGRAVGVSSERPWPRSGVSYQGALHALSGARSRATRVALETGEPVAVLLPKPARRWGRAMTAQLGAVTGTRRTASVRVAQLVLAHGDAKTSSCLRVPRQTVGDRLAEVMGTMGLSRGSLIHRACADLAMQLTALPLEEGSSDDAPEGLSTLLMRTSEATAWAEQYLACLDERQLEVLTAWLAADGMINTAAERLGVGRNTIRRHLTQAGTRLSRALRDPGVGPHDPLWALLLTGRLSVSLLPPDASSPPQ